MERLHLENSEAMDVVIRFTLASPILELVSIKRMMSSQADETLLAHGVA